MFLSIFLELKLPQITSELVNDNDLMGYMYIVQGLGLRFTSFTTSYNMRETTHTFGAFHSYLEGYIRMIAHQNGMDVRQSSSQGCCLRIKRVL